MKITTQAWETYIRRLAKLNEKAAQLMEIAVNFQNYNVVRLGKHAVFRGALIQVGHEQQVFSGLAQHLPGGRGRGLKRGDARYCPDISYGRKLAQCAGQVAESAVNKRISQSQESGVCACAQHFQHALGVAAAGVI